MLKDYLKKWALLFLIIIFNLIIALRTSIGFFAFFFWALLVAVAVSLLWILLSYFGANLSLERRTISKVYTGDTLEIKATIRNDSPLPLFNLVLEDSVTCAPVQERQKRILIEYLGAGSTVEYNCTCYKRGRYNLGPFVIYFFDPFGIFFLKRRYEVYSELYVYPRTFLVRKFPQLTRGILPWFGIETTRVSGDDDEFFGTREYKEGDPVKRIHWFSTARKNRLIVRQFQRQSFFRATIIFNLHSETKTGEEGDSIAEAMIRITASVAKYLLERGVALEIIAHVGELVHIPYNKGAEHLEDIMKFLAVAQPESQVNLSEIFENFSHYIPNDSNLIVVMVDKDWESLQRMFSLEKRSVSLIPLILVSSTFFYKGEPGEIRIKRDVESQLSQALNFSPMLFSRGDNFEEVFLRY